MSRLLPLLCALLLLGCPDGFRYPEREFAPPVAEGKRHGEQIHLPSDLGIWDAPLSDDPSLPERAACDVCHGPDPKTFVGSHFEGDRFHTTVEIEHGPLVCDQCHDADRTKLRLADGTKLDFPDLIRLCGQCHGPQKRDYEHAAHGGVNGYWDTRRGPRIRNSCIDCHPPHRPATEQVMPVFKPRDRYLQGHGGGHGEEHAEGGPDENHEPAGHEADEGGAH